MSDFQCEHCETELEGEAYTCIACNRQGCEHCMPDGTDLPCPECSDGTTAD